MTAAITQIEAAVDLLKELIRPEILVWRMGHHSLIREANHKPTMVLIIELRYDDRGYFPNAVEARYRLLKALDEA